MGAPQLIPCRLCIESKPLPEFAPSEVRRFIETSGSRRPRCRRCDKERARKAYAGGYRTPYMSEKRYLGRRKPKPSGKDVECTVCGIGFRRTTGRMACCSEVCSQEARRRRYRKKSLARRWQIREGDDYTTFEIIERDAAICHLCKKKVNPHLSGMDRWGPTIDHLVPLSRGGTDVRSNVALAHRICNIRRGNRDMAQLPLVGVRRAAQA